jgi:formate dehydrogenase assembly factor FdhD
MQNSSSYHDEETKMQVQEVTHTHRARRTCTKSNCGVCQQLTHSAMWESKLGTQKWMLNTINNMKYTLPFMEVSGTASQKADVKLDPTK